MKIFQNFIKKTFMTFAIILAMFPFALGNFSVVQAAEGPTTITIKAIPQDDLKKGQMSIYYYLYDVTNDSIITKDYLYAENDYRTQIDVNGGTYKVIIPSYVEDATNEALPTYNSFDYQDGALDTTIGDDYFDFLYGEDEFIANNKNLLSRYQDQVDAYNEAKISYENETGEDFDSTAENGIPAELPSSKNDDKFSFKLNKSVCLKIVIFLAIIVVLISVLRKVISVIKDRREE